jgi:hypothetical protein
MMPEFSAPVVEKQRMKKISKLIKKDLTIMTNMVKYKKKRGYIEKVLWLLYIYSNERI